MDEDRALELLGLPADADTDAIKRTFRRLVHDLHPDRGGDPHAFHDVHVAYRLLLAERERPDRPIAPRVARGRPSRVDRVALDPSFAAAADTGPTGPLLPLTPAERAALAASGRNGRSLDGGALARLLVDGGVQLVSRAPGSRANRFATLLDTGSMSTLRADATSVELIARSRAARRAISGLDLATVAGPTWSRHRGDALMVLRTTLTDEHRSRGATPDARLRMTAAAIAALLDALAWPLRSWRIDGGRDAAGRTVDGRSDLPRS